MPASYPSSVKTFTVKVDGAGNLILAQHVNDMQDEITAIEQGLINGVQHNFLPNIDNTRDLGSTTLNWKDLYLKVTQGRVLFAGASGLVSDSSGLTWDDTAKALRIETAQVAQILAETDATLPNGRWRMVVDGNNLRLDQNTHASTEFSTFGSPILVDASGNVELGGASAGGGTYTRTMRVGVSRGQVTAYSTGSGDRGFSHEQVSGDTTSAALFLKKARGTFGSEAAVSSGDVVGQMIAAGHNGTSYQNVALVRVNALENYSGSALGSALAFWLVTAGTTTLAEVAQMRATRFDFTQACVRATKTGTQSVAAAGAAINFDSEAFDSDALHDNATNNVRLTASVTGKYNVGGWVRRGIATTNGNWTVRIRKNGTTTVAQWSNADDGSENTLNALLTTLIDLAAGDWVDLFVLHSDSANIVIQSDAAFWMHLVSR